MIKRLLNKIFPQAKELPSGRVHLYNTYKKNGYTIKETMSLHLMNCNTKLADKNCEKCQGTGIITTKIHRRADWTLCPRCMSGYNLTDILKT